MDQNSQLLKDSLEAMPLLAGRYANLKLVNVDPVSGKKRGCFSLVFKADDTIEKKSVAIKFYDPDPAVYQDAYRVAAFRREHEILQVLQGSERCLQLVSSLAVFDLSFDVGGGKSLTLPCEYFVMDWLEEEVDEYFFGVCQHSALEKIKLIFDVVLAIESLHGHRVFHRDVKADNLRAFHKAARRIVVAIDLGAAARHDSGAIQKNYGKQVGALGYSSPEAVCGLAGNRLIAPYNDHYAIGCLLFDLFNPDFFYRAIRNMNPFFDARLGVMKAEVVGAVGDEKQLEAWKRALAKIGGGIASPVIDGLGSSAPRGVASILNEILAALTNIDYRKRSVGTQWVKMKLLSAIKALENEVYYQRQLAISKERRRRREQAMAEKAQRLAAFIQKRCGDGNN